MIIQFLFVLAWAWRRTIDRILSKDLALHEYAELAFLRDSIDSIRHQNLYSVLLEIDDQESIETFDNIFSPREESELEILRVLTLSGKNFKIFSLQERKSQLRLIIDYSNGYKILISEFL